MSGATSGLTGRATNPAGVAAGPITPWKKSSGRFSTNENLRFFRTLRVRDRIPAIQHAVDPQPAGGHARRRSRGPCGQSLLAAALVAVAMAAAGSPPDVRAADGGAAAVPVATRGPRPASLESSGRRDDDMVPERIDRERSTWRRADNAADGLELPTRAVIRWGECPPWPAGPLVLLAGGGVVAGRIEAADAARVTIRSPSLGRFELPAGSVTGFRRSQAHGPGPLAAHARAAPSATLLLANGDILSASPAAWRDGAIEIDTAAGTVAIPADLIEAVDLAAPAAPATAADAGGPRVLVAFADGSRLPLTGLWPAADPDRFVIAVDLGDAPVGEAPGGAAQATAGCDRAEVVAVFVDGGAARALVSLVPVAYAQEPILGPAWPLAVGRTLTGGWPAARDSSGFSGLGIHALASVRYRLERPAARLVARVAVDDTAAGRGAVVVRVRERPAAGEWREAFASATLCGGHPPLHLDVPLDPRAGSDEIELVVEAADEADVLARTIWLDPFVVAAP